MRAVITCVDFGDILGETLPRNRHHWEGVLVVTHPADLETARVALACGAEVFLTEAFHAGGAAFNKFAALEAALDYYGRRGWLALVDADVVWPASPPPVRFRPGRLYSFARRRLLLGAAAPVPPECEWGLLPLDPQYGECLGFTQVFHAADKRLGRPPWHRLDLESAALGDSLFQDRWDLSEKVWIDADVLHLGEYAANWCGRVTPRRDGTAPEGAQARRERNEALRRRLWPAPAPEGG